MNAKVLLCFLLMALTSLACFLPVLGAAQRTPTTPLPAVTITMLPDTTTPPVESTGVSPTLPSSQNDTVSVFLIKLEDNGQSGSAVGCGDSLVRVGTAVPAGDNPLVSAYSALFAIRDERVGPQGLYNTVHASNMVARSVDLDDNGRAEVRLEGTYSLGGVCDTPRMIAQLEAAALQFPQVREVEVYLNDVPIQEALSSQ